MPSVKILFIYYWYFYVEKVNNHIFITDFHLDDPYLYSDIFILAIVFIPFFYIIFNILLNQNILEKYHNFRGIGLIWSLIVYKLSFSFTYYAFNYIYHTYEDSYYKVYRTFQVLTHISLWDYSYQCFRVFKLIGIKYTDLFIYFYLILKYIFLIYLFILFIAVYLEFRISILNFYIITERIIHYSDFFLGFTMYLISFILILPKLHAFLPQFLKKHIKLLAFLMNFEFITEKIFSAILGSIAFEIYFWVKNDHPIYYIIWEVFYVSSFLFRFLPLFIIIMFLAVEKDESDVEKESLSIV